MSNSMPTERPPQRDNMLPDKLPFDPRTLLLGLWRRKWVLIFFFVVSCVVGYMAGKRAGEKVYQAETTLLYRPQLGAKELDEVPVPLLTQMNMVAIQSNLEETIRRIGLDTDVVRLGRAITIEVKEENRDPTNLLAIRAQWTNADAAAKIANTLRDVFLVNQARVQREDRCRHRLEVLQQMSADAVQSQREVIRQTEEVDTQIEKLQRLAKSGETGMPLASLPELNIQIQHIRDAINQDKTHRANVADMNEKKLDYDRKVRLHAEGLVAQADVDAARSRYEQAEALTKDTDKIRAWKTEMQDLDNRVIPSAVAASGGPSPSSFAMQNVMTRAFDIALQKTALEERTKYLQGECEKAKKTLDEALADERRRGPNNPEAPLVRPQPGATDFSIVSIATPPPNAIRSTSKIIALGIVLAGTWIGFVLILAAELLDPTIRTESELELKLDLPVLGTLPTIYPVEDVFPGAEDSALFEQFKVIAWQIRHKVPKRGARILVVSARSGEGRTTVAANLAACFGRQDERVLAVDGHVRPGSSDMGLARLITEMDKPLVGLGEYLSFQAEHLEDVIWPTSLPGVECLPRVEEAIIPDLLGSNRMREMLDEVSQRYSIIVLDSPPVLPYVDAHILAQWSDAIVFVVRSRTCRRATVRRALQQMQTTHVPILGAVLNDVARVYIDT